MEQVTYRSRVSTTPNDRWLTLSCQFYRKGGTGLGESLAKLANNGEGGGRGGRTRGT